MKVATVPENGREIVPSRNAIKISRAQRRLGLPPISGATWTWLW